MTSDQEHQKAQNRTGFWGTTGAGCLIGALRTGRILFPFRSRHVNEPHTWGTWGGAIDRGESPEEAVRREVEEETGHHLPVELIPLFVFSSGSFRYHNFLALVEQEFVPVMNWETEGYRWVEFGKWPSPLHFGTKSLLMDSGSLRKIKSSLSESQ